jgi:calcineurin-like phosphoesterase family protein
VGDSGLTRIPEDHPYIVLAEVALPEKRGPRGVMDVIARGAEETDPLQLEIRNVPGPVQGTSGYEVNPSPGLKSFILMLCRSCPVQETPGSLVKTLDDGKSGSFVMTPFFPRMEEGNRSGIGHKEQRTNYPRQNSLGAGDSDPVMVDILRIVLRKGGLMVAEYDLVRKKWLQSAESNKGKNAKASLRSFRIRKGFQMTGPSLSPEPEILVISDLHLGHRNSIPRYKRPFFCGNIREMDRVIIRNWNWSVKENDIVIFLGDLSFMSEEKPESYLGKLGGSIFYLEGNHDPYYSYMSHCLLMCYRDVRYLFIHDPEELARPFDGWVIHGHVHNKDPARYPFFNPIKRTVNVSAEMIGYRPISLKEIHSLVTGTEEVIRFRDVAKKDLPEMDRPLIAESNCPGLISENPCASPLHPACSFMHQ